jgi:A118 family predicted phage portal protein
VGLPTSADSAWPPRDWRAIQADLDEAAVWYAGDPDKLNAFYLARRGTDERPSRRRWWGRAQQTATGESTPRKLHVPAAADIASTSADLLFGEPPVIRIAEAHKTTSDTAAGDTDAKATEDRLHELEEKLGLANTLLEGAEVAAALGGVYLRIVWDSEVADHPLLTVVHADMAVPEFTFGVLTAVTFWRCIDETSTTRVRHLERHEKGVVLHGVYVGDRDNIGVPSQLENHAATKNLQPEVRTPDGVDGLLVRYVPNVLPNRKHRNRPVGRGDTMGAEGLMDALDLTYSSWMRDIDLGKARIVVPEDWLTTTKRGQGAQFDIDRDVFTGLPGVDPATMGSAPITPNQFKIRTEDHAATALALWEKIISGGGYSGQTFGLNGEGGDSTATEVRARQAKSLRTRGRKERYWQPALADTLYNLLAVDKAVFNGKATPIRPGVDLRDGMDEPMRERAETARFLKDAQAASVRTRVQMAQPDLDGDELDAEVQLILNEEALNVPDPTGGFA